MQGHLDAVTSLDVDPAGLTLVSGGHDCSVRFWDLASGPAKEATAIDAEEDESESNERGSSHSQSKSSSSTTTENTTACVQEISAHRKKAGEGVLAVKYHPSAPFFASAGADGIIRIYG